VGGGRALHLCGVNAGSYRPRPMSRKALLFVLAVLIHLGPTRIEAAEPVKLLPPGDCTKAVYRELNTAVGHACKSENMECTPEMDCVSLMTRWSLFERCIDARQTLMNRCFRGGDETHRITLRGYMRGQNRCLDFIQITCRVDGKCSE
jgi:hypothetical protein